MKHTQLVSIRVFMKTESKRNEYLNDCRVILRCAATCICSTNIPSKKSSAQVGVWVNSVLTRNDCIKCYISLFKEIILQQFDAFQTEIQGSLTKLCAFKASRGHSSKVVKLPTRGPMVL